jgi:hypothetical protein
VVRLNILTNEIRPDGELIDRLAASIEVRGQELVLAEGSLRFLQVGMPVYSERYNRLIDFDTSREEWARHLPSTYRNGAVNVTAEEITTPSSPTRSNAVLAFEHPHQPD